MESSLLDSLVYVGIVLLILSQITEKITTFLRSYIKVALGPKVLAGKRRRRKTLPQKLAVRLFGTIAMLDDVSDLAKSKIRTVQPEDKTRVEFAITKLSILVGFLIALAFKANLFAIFMEGNPHQQLGWSGFQYSFCRLPYEIAGCLATGFLLTFGSKFFHDLLELLYDVKRLRGKMADEAIYRSPDKETLDQRIDDRHDDPVLAVYERHYKSLLHEFPNIVSIARVFDKNGTSFLEIRVKDNQLERLKQYNFSYVEGEAIRALPEFKIRLVPNTPQATPLGGTLWVGDWTFNFDTPENMGTLGFFAKRNGKTVLVTCYHVLRTDEHGWDNLGTPHPNANQVYGKTPSGGNDMVYIGKMVAGAINSRVDCAVVELASDFISSNQDPEWGAFQIGKASEISENAEVRVNGAKSDPGTGIVSSIENIVLVDYGTRIVSLNNLIRIKNKKNEGEALTQKGDSGAVVLDGQSKAIAMVIAGDGQYTYAVPIERMTEDFLLT